MVIPRSAAICWSFASATGSSRTVRAARESVRVPGALLDFERVARRFAGCLAGAAGVGRVPEVRALRRAVSSGRGVARCAFDGRAAVAARLGFAAGFVAVAPPPA